MNADGFWNIQETAQKLIKELKGIRATIEPLLGVEKLLGDVRTLYELAAEANDTEALDESDQLLTKAEHDFEKVELQALFSGPHDISDCYVQIHAGAGGTEACDWTSMLFRMYLKYWEKQGWDVSELERTDGEQAGIRSVTLQVKGTYATGIMNCEVGVHRLVRISPFDANARRHTSFASVDVTPVFEGEGDAIVIPDIDLEIVAFVRSSGPGGQNVNKVASAIRVVHKPTGLMVVCTSERSQVQNKALALNLILAKVQKLEETKRDAELSKLYGEKGEISFGSQIRSYIMDDRRVKDHRNGQEVFQPDRILDGDIQEFIDAQLRFKARNQKSKP